MPFGGVLTDRARLVSWATLAAMALATVWVIPRAAAVLAVDSSPPLEWVPPTFPARVAYEQFAARFGSSDVVVITWDGCTLGSTEAERLVDACRSDATPRGENGEPWFEDATSGRAILERLTGEPLLMPRDEAVAWLQGTLIGPDGESTCVVVPLTPAGLDARRHAVAWLRRQVADAGIPAEAARFAGPAIDNVAVDEASSRSLRRYGPLAAIVVLLLTWRALGSLVHACLVFATSLFCVGLAFASLQTMGDRMNPVLIVMPLLVLVLGVCCGVHLVNYLIESYATGSLATVPRRALRVGWLPCLLSATTTAVGLLSLVVSQLEPVRVFGFHAAIGVMATVVLLFLIMPGAFQQFPIRRRSASLPAACALLERTALARAVPITMVLAVCLAGLAAGLPRLRSSVSIETLFPPTSRILEDYAWIERHIGCLGPIELVVHFAGDATRPAERLDIVREVAAVVADLPEVTSVLSAGTLFVDGDERSGTQRALRKALIARKLEASLASLDDLRLVHADAEGEHWRITARTSMLGDLDATAFLATLRKQVAPVLEAYDGAARGISISDTGAVPVIQAIQRSLLHDLATSFLTACGVTSLVMILVQQSVVAGLLGMTVNVFPVLILFGVLGWTRVPVDIGGVMTASIALGMAIDGTLHFLTFFRRHFVNSAGGQTDRQAAIHAAFTHASEAILQTAVICSLSMPVFAASEFAPTRRFAWMLTVLVILAFLGDLLVLPALLASPLRKMSESVWSFRRRLLRPICFPRASAPAARRSKGPRPRRGSRN
jgi:predicted RND superfamily exporter protein